MKVEAGLTTFFPRPEEIVAATREMERGKRPASDVDALYKKWTEQLMTLERQEGLSWTTGGHMSWHDLFRPFVESSTGLVPGALTRWFETNTFYRRPVIEDEPKAVAGAISKRYRAHGSKLGVVMPGPYTFAHLAENKTGRPDGEVHLRLADFLGNEAAELSNAGVENFVIHEPLLARTEKVSSSELEKLYKPVLGAIGQKRTIVWSYFGDGTWAVKNAQKLPVRAIGVDLADTPMSNILAMKFPKGKALGIGCIDPRTSLPEDPAELARIVKGVSGKLGVGEVILGPGAPMDLLPWDSAVMKLETLPEAVKRCGKA